MMRAANNIQSVLAKPSSKKPKKVPKNRSQQHRTTTEPVGETPQQRCANQLRGSVRSDQNSGHQFTGFESLGIIRQQRQNQAEAKQVDKNDQKNRCE